MLLQQQDAIQNPRLVGNAEVRNCLCCRALDIGPKQAAAPSQTCHAIELEECRRVKLLLWNPGQWKPAWATVTAPAGKFAPVYPDEGEGAQELVRHDLESQPAERLIVGRFARHHRLRVVHRRPLWGRTGTGVPDVAVSHTGLDECRHNSRPSFGGLPQTDGVQHLILSNVAAERLIHSIGQA